VGVEEGQDSVYTPLNVVEQQTARDLHEHGDLWLEILLRRPPQIFFPDPRWLLTER